MGARDMDSHPSRSVHLYPKELAQWVRKRWLFRSLFLLYVVVSLTRMRPCEVKRGHIARFLEHRAKKKNRAYLSPVFPF